MASHRANLFCVLKMEPNCDACKRQTMEILGSIDGVYDITMDAETKTVRIAGEVDPNYCVKALARCGIHAELIRANLTHPRLLSSRAAYNRDYYDDYIYPPSSYYYDDYSHNNYTSNYYGGYRMGRSLPEGMYHEYPSRRNTLPEYSYNRNVYNYDGSSNIPYAVGEPLNLCSIL